MGLGVYILRKIEDFPLEYWTWKAQKEKCLEGLKGFVGFDEDTNSESDYRELYNDIERYFNRQCPCESDALYHENISHNYNKLAKQIEVYEELWRPEECDPPITKAGQLIEPLTNGLNLIKNKEWYYMETAGGRDQVNLFVSFVERYLYYCCKYPDNPIEVER